MTLTSILLGLAAWTTMWVVVGLTLGALMRHWPAFRCLVAVENEGPVHKSA
jgi:hypothetical protein